MKIQKTTIKIKDQFDLIDVITSTVDVDLIFAITRELELLKIQISTEKIIKNYKIEKGKLDLESNFKLHLSPSDKYVGVTNGNGQYGLLFDLEKEQKILDLDRKNYHSVQTEFPIQFIEKEGHILLIHATDWNNLEVTDLHENKLLTKRINKYQSEFYLDYFYGSMHLSPNKKKVLSSGWVWGPASVLKIIDIENWLIQNINEPEINRESDYCIMSYYWERALCWIDDHTIAFLYDPKEEDLEEEDYQELNMTKENSYISFYDINKAKIIRSFVMNDYTKNEYHEATPDCQLFYNGNLVFCSESKGVIMYTIEGQKIYEGKNLHIEKRDPIFNRFYILKNNKIEFIKINSEN